MLASTEGKHASSPSTDKSHTVSYTGVGQTDDPRFLSLRIFKQGLVYDCRPNNNKFHLGLENWLNRTEHPLRSEILGRPWLAVS